MLIRLSTRRISIAAAVLAVVGGGLAVTGFESGGDAKKAPPAAVVWTLPDKPDPGVRAVVGALFKGERRRAAAQEEFVYRCMELRGFSYIKPQPPAEVPVPPDFGISVKNAARYGYRVPPVEPRRNSSPVDQTAGLAPAAKKAWGIALNGRDDGPTVRVQVPGGVIQEHADGCLADARTRIYGSLSQQVRLQHLTGHLPVMTQERFAADPALVRLDQTWSACMAAKGYRGLKAPEDARAAAVGMHRKQMRLTRAETRMAVADAGCQAASGYEQQRRLLEDRYYTAGLHYFGGGVDELRAASERSFRQAAQILQGAG